MGACRPRRWPALLLLTVLLAAAAGLLPRLATDAGPPADTAPYGATGAKPGLLYPDVLYPTDLSGASADGPGGAAADGGTGIPVTVLAAYHRAESELATRAPGCHLPWSLVAGIGKVESDHARGGAVDATGTSLTPILGPVLNGAGATSAVPDTDHGRLDRDTVWDRAVGPTQFLPATWAAYGIAVAHTGAPTAPEPDGASPDVNNVFDAAVGTGRYLCAGGGDVATPAGAHDAVFTYNHSEDYVAHVLAWARAYAAGASTIPDTTTLAADDPQVAAEGEFPSLATTVGIPAAGLPAPADPTNRSFAAPGSATAVPAPPPTTPGAPPPPGSTPRTPAPTKGNSSPPTVGVPAPSIPGGSRSPVSPPESAAASPTSVTTPAVPPASEQPATSRDPAEPARPTTPPPGDDWCATHLPPSSVAPLFGQSPTAARTTSTRDARTVTCSVTIADGPLLNAVATTYAEQASANRAAEALPASANSLADMLVVNGPTRVRLTVPVPPPGRADAGITVRTATTALTRLSSRW